jgi:hypothetical protein
MTEMTPHDLPKNSGILKGVRVQSPAPPFPPTPTSAIADTRFLDALVLEYIDGHDWKTVSPFWYVTDVAGGDVIHVPAGFVTDFASVPKALWNILPPTGKYGKAALIHDYCYRTPGIASKANADSIFLEAMTALGVGWWTRNTMYRGVRYFGGHNYKGGL